MSAQLQMDTAPEATVWRRVGDLVVTRRSLEHGGVAYRALDGDTVVARFVDNTKAGGGIGGHIDHRYAWVQGDDAPCRTVTAWLEQLARRGPDESIEAAGARQEEG